MRPGPNPKRSRGRNGRRPGSGGSGGGGGGGGNVPSRNQTYDSNGPEVRIRGNAYQVHEKYLALARDAHSAGDRIMAESYLQHAEHYYRIIASINEQSGGDRRNFRQDGNTPANNNGGQGQDGNRSQNGGNGRYDQQGAGMNGSNEERDEDEDGEGEPREPYNV